MHCESNNHTFSGAASEKEKNLKFVVQARNFSLSNYQCVNRQFSVTLYTFSIPFHDGVSLVTNLRHGSV